MKAVIVAILSLIFSHGQTCGQEFTKDLHTEVNGRLFAPNGFKIVLCSNKSNISVLEYQVKYFSISIINLSNDGKIEENFANDSCVMKNDAYFKYVTALQNGKYGIKIVDIICGPAGQENTDLNSFRMKDLFFEIEK